MVQDLKTSDQVNNFLLPNIIKYYDINKDFDLIISGVLASLSTIRLRMDPY